MPRFHFNIYEGHASKDQQGTELENYEMARRQAIALAGSVLVEESREPQVGNEWRVEVTDERGLILYRLDIMVSEAAAVSQR